MAITECKECNGKVSTEAKVCPHCGYELVEPSTRNKMTGLPKWGWASILLLAIISIVMVFAFTLVNAPIHHSYKLAFIAFAIGGFPYANLPKNASSGNTIASWLIYGFFTFGFFVTGFM